jgi:hypothetical protein
MLCFATEAAAQAPTPREAALETRVHELELRLNELEAQLSARSQRNRRAERTLEVPSSCAFAAGDLSRYRRAATGDRGAGRARRGNS